MCRLCQTNPVYEFTNKRKLCGRCFIRYFEKKVLYTLRKFNMIRHDDIIRYRKGNDFRSAVLSEILKFILEKSGIRIVRLPNKQWEPPAGSSQLQQIRDPAEFGAIREIAHPNKKLKAGKIAVDSSIDSEAEEIIKELIKGNAVNLKKNLPVEGKIIKPLYLFLDEEILLYARLKKLKFISKKNKVNRIRNFMDESEKKHPEIKRAIVNSLLALHQNNK